jgi:hypothetical protein
VITVEVAQRGGDSRGPDQYGHGGWGATGYGGGGGTATRGDAGGGGGGATRVEIADCHDCQRALILTAGGGGGAGGEGENWRNNGGRGGNSAGSAEAGASGSGIGVGSGGSGGANSSGAGTSGANGGLNGGAGGGGGAGQAGGHGGRGSTGVGGGGGGGAGSSQITALLRHATVGRGPVGDGLATITFSHLLCPNQQVNVQHNSVGTEAHLCVQSLPPEGFRLLAGPQHGHLSDLDLQRGTFRYVPHAGFGGTDTATFVAFSGVRESEPFVVKFVVARLCFDQTIDVPSNSDGTHVQLYCSFAQDPGQFRITLSAGHGHLDDRDMHLGTFNYVLLPDFAGTDTVKFVSVNHGYASAVATVTLAVRSSLAPACSHVGFEHVPASVVHVKLMCPAVGADPRYRLISGPRHGGLARVHLGQGEFRYIPDSGYLGQDSIVIRASGRRGSPVEQD